MNNKILEVQQAIKTRLQDSDCDVTTIIEEVGKEFGCKFSIINVGGYESPGYDPKYDVDCYSWATIINGELYHDSYEQESY